MDFANYFRRFIEGYSVISRPLEHLTGKHARFNWDADAQKAFDQLRHALVTAPVLQLADVKKMFRVVTDASDESIAGVLLQEDHAGHWHPVAYTSRRLRPEECNYHANDREALAVLHALRTWRLYLFSQFELVTDNQAVTCLLTKSRLSRREARWVNFLADFDIKFLHKPGKNNVADALSRVPEC